MGVDGASGVGSALGPRQVRGSEATLFLLTMTAGYAVYAADRTVLASVLTPLSSSLGLTSVEKGFLGSAQYAGVLSVVLIAGHLSDRFGKWKMVLTGILVFSAFTWAIAFSKDFYQAFLFRFLSGVGEGIFWPVAMSAVANYFQVRKGLALGAFYVGFDAGGAGGSAIGGATYALTSDWRTAFLVAPLLGVAAVAGLFITRGAFSKADAGVGSLSLGREALSLLGRRDVLYVLLFAFLATYPIAAWQLYLPTYWSAVSGVSVPVAAYGAAAVLVSGGIGKVLIGAASDRWRRDLLLAGLSAGSVVFFGLFFYAQDVYLGFACALAAGFLSSAIFPVMQALAADSCEGRTGTALGLTTTFQSVASVLSPTITSLFFPQGVGKAVAVNVMVPMALVVATALLLRDPGRKGRRDEGMKMPSSLRDGRAW